MKLEPPWLYDLLLFGLPIVIVAAQLAVEWYAARNRRKVQALAIRTDTVPSGYFRIGPYLDTTEDQASFNRADHAHERVLA